MRVQRVEYQIQYFTVVSFLEVGVVTWHFLVPFLYRSACFIWCLPDSELAWCVCTRVQYALKLSDKWYLSERSANSRLSRSLDRQTLDRRVQAYRSSPRNSE